MNPLERLDPEALVALSDTDFQDHVKGKARSKTEDVLDMLDTVMASSDDDMARIQAGDRILKLAQAQEESATPLSSISEDLLKSALAGLLLAGKVIREARPEPILRDVTPLRLTSVPLETLPDTSPLNVPHALETEAEELPKDAQILIEENKPS